eukprot:12905547-Prorocentrum_lima.AAC.1
MQPEHHKVVPYLEETAQRHHNAVVRQKEEEYEPQLQQKQANVNHGQSVPTSSAQQKRRKK